MAYEQYINNELKAQFTADDMYYVMMNPRSKTPYGLAPLESLIIAVDGALRSQLYNLDMLAEGNIPEGFLSIPPDWTMQQIKEYQMWFDSMIAGNPRFQSRIKMIPGGQGLGYTATKKPEEMRFLEFEKWLMKITCSIFDVPPEEIGFTESVNRATAEVQHEIGKSAGLEPMLATLKELFDQVIHDDFGVTQLEWKWRRDVSEDKLKEAQEFEILVKTGAISVDEWRAEHDKAPIGLEAYVMTSQGPMMVKDIISGKFQTQQITPASNETTDQQQKEQPKDQPSKENQPAEKMIDELEKWKRKALKDARDGRTYRIFKSDIISQPVQAIIETQLMFSKDREQVRKVFDDQLKLAREEMILEEAMCLKNKLDKALKVDEPINSN